MMSGGATVDLGPGFEDSEEESDDDDLALDTRAPPRVQPRSSGAAAAGGGGAMMSGGGNGGAHAQRPEHYSMQAAKDCLPSIPVLTLRHKNAKLFRESGGPRTGASTVRDKQDG